MSHPTRIALLHTGAVVIPMAAEYVKRELPDVTPINYLDDRIVADLGDPETARSVPGRVGELARAAVDAGADAILLTCSSISELAADTAEKVGVPILRIDEAMADEAVATGDRIAVLATLATTCGPTTRLIEERAKRAGRTPAITSVVVDGAFEAVSSGDRPTHDRLVAAAIERAAANADVVVLAQASMASAAKAAEVDVPVLTSLESGVRRMRSLVESLPARA
ncbi:aspartate/glutamate racemase family protein [Naasia sp. SYSU D00948]|uniref:aspartate/glutamate racemase family protein n=1 Tax=Naasia sp. SYSU D00948 TaxID=2817379 RepID=UPI001B31226E|nr:aspartate/glutamate racemase family protein [Naasia sp. SYSU D00948]